MKKRTLAILLPVVAGLGLAGTGFGAWVFSNNVSAASAGASINVTAACEVTGVKVVMDDDTITLDQNEKEDLKFSYKIVLQAKEITGMNETVSNPSNYNDTTVNYLDAVDTYLNKDITYDITYNAKVSFDVGGAAATYLSIDGKTYNRDLSGATMTLKYVVDADDSTKGEWTIVDANDGKTGLNDTQEVAVTWNSTDVTAGDSKKDADDKVIADSNAKPTTAGEYKQMVSAFKSNPGSIKVNLTDFEATAIAEHKAAQAQA